MRKKKTQTVDLTVLLTVYRRDHLGAQLDAIAAQTIQPRRVVVFQNGNHVRLPNVGVRDPDVECVRNSKNTGFFGRFAYLTNADTRWVAVLDDDIIPGPNFIANYMNQAMALDGIVGGNGRIGRLNPYRKSLFEPKDYGIREQPVLVDFVGHCWFFRRDLLFDMFSFRPETMQTGEDMHLCFSSKLRSGVKSVVAMQPSMDASCDVTNDRLAKDPYSSYRKTRKSSRELVEKSFLNRGLVMISPEQQKTFSTGSIQI